jgi:tripartite-type tricarboxylate transporter receptor subunit TctC
MRRLVLIVGFTVAFASIEHTAAQVYPSRPITMVVPFAVGGPTDAIGRIIAERMRGALGQPVITENVTGAAGNIGVGRVARAAGDGYTLGIGAWSTHVVNGAIYALPYDLLKDFVPIALIATNPNLILAKTAVPANDLRELVAWLKANPDKATLGTAGVGSPPHIAGVFFQKLTGTSFQFVPYRGGGPALQDLIAGQLDLNIPQAAIALPQVSAGKVKAFAVTANARLSSAPDIPTVDEAGVPGLYISVWHGLWAPKGTASNIITMLNAAVVDALADPAVRRHLIDLGQDIPPRSQQTPEALGSLHSAEIARWWPVIKAANIKGE